MTRTNYNDEKQWRKVNKIVDELTLFDDDLMSHVFDKNIEATELILRIILGRNIKVISVDGQDEFKNPIVGGRNIILDIHAVEETDEEIDIEVQGDAKGASLQRARFHSSMMDARMLKEGQEFTELKDSYVIFIYKNDKFNAGRPVYHINRRIQETDNAFEDGSHIIYVNGSYKGNDDIARLMDDFRQTESENMHFKVLAQGVEHYKETEKGRETMCDAVKEYAKEYAYEREMDTKKGMVKNLMKNAGFTLDQAFNMLDLNSEDRSLLTAELKK